MAEESKPTPAVSDEAEAPEAEEPLSVEGVLAWKGFKLDDLGGATVGKIEGAYVDETTGRPEWLLARMGRFGHHCLVPARDAVVASGHVWVPYKREQVRKAPRLDAGKPLERDLEVKLLEHYGVGTTDVGRGADLAKREPDAITARPA